MCGHTQCAVLLDTCTHWHLCTAFEQHRREIYVNALYRDLRVARHGEQHVPWVVIVASGHFAHANPLLLPCPAWDAAH